MSTEQMRTYDRARSVVFLKTDAPFGGLSNMAGGFPLLVNGMRILTSEALYQACRFPHRSEVQRLIIEQTSPMTAKMKSKPYRSDSRPDWDHVRVKIMRWCLRVKLAQNWRTFSTLLLETGERPIVEESRRDDFWGANPTAEGTLVGMNVLGRLLMELREVVKTEDPDSLTQVQPPAIPDFLLCEQPIGTVGARDYEPNIAVANRAARWAPVSTESAVQAQPSLFDRLEIREPPPPPYLDVDAAGVHVTDLKPYPDYKDSGLPWLGQIPSGWRVVRNGSLFGQRNQTGFGGLPILEVSLKTGVRVRSFETSKRKQIMADLDKYKYAAGGDIAYNMMRMWQGAVGVAPVDGLVSPAYVVARPFADVEPRFFTTLFRTADYMAEVDSCSRGIVKDRNRLYWEQFKQIASPCPPPDEQAAIVRFLDWANSRLDRAIRAKRKVIALLNEQKQAIIHRAVTRGLDPSVPLKPSGIPWLGDIPQHWSLKRFKFLATINSGQVDPRKAEYRDLALIAPNHIQSGSGILLKLETATEQGANSGKYLVNRGQLIYSKIRPKLRKAIVAPCNCLCSADMYPIEPRSGELSTSYLLLLLLSQPFTKFAIDTSMRVAMPKVNREALENCWMWYPNAQEQSLILGFIALGSEPLDTAITRLEREVELLREYRTRLVADVVTGKLDVREAASRLPDEAPPETSEADPDLIDDPEALDEEAAA